MERRRHDLTRQLSSSLKPLQTTTMGPIPSRKIHPKSMEECNSLGHERTWFLPHHPVINPRKPRKCRLIFDAAAMEVSLNSKLLKGELDLRGCFRRRSAQWTFSCALDNFRATDGTGGGRLSTLKMHYNLSFKAEVQPLQACVSSSI